MTLMPATSQRLLVMPDDGAKAVVELIDQAREQLLLKQFKLQSELVEQALRRAVERGVQVRVMLNPHTSGGDRWNDEAFALLQQWGIAVAWTSEAFPVTHEKSMVVDHAAAQLAEEAGMQVVMDKCPKIELFRPFWKPKLHLTI